MHAESETTEKSSQQSKMLATPQGLVRGKLEARVAKAKDDEDHFNEAGGGGVELSLRLFSAAVADV
jgi:hypothetical protein